MNQIMSANISYYDALSSFYDKKHNISIEDFEFFKMDLEELGHNPLLLKGKKVIDCGCGTGRGTLKFALLGCETTAVDISKEIVDICAANAQKFNIKINIFAGDCKKLPYENESFDIVSTSAALHHMPDLKEVLFEFKRILKRNGYLILFAEPKLSVIRPKWMIGIKEFLSERYDRRVAQFSCKSVNPDVHVFNIGKLSELLKEIGFGDIRKNCFFTLSSIYRDLFYYMIRRDKIRNWLQKKVNIIDRKYLSFLFDNFKALFNLSAKKIKKD